MKDPNAELADDVFEATQIDPGNITADMVRVPSDLALWGERYARVYEAWQIARLTRERVYAETFRAIQDEINLLSPKRATVAETEQATSCHPAYQETRVQEIAAETEKIRLAGILDSLRAKKDMLVSIGAQMRAEMGSQDLSIRRQTEIINEVDRNRNR